MLTSLLYYGKVVLLYHCLQVDKCLLINLCLKLSRLRQLKKHVLPVKGMYVCVCVCMYVCMYEIRDRQDPVKGSGWVLFPSTMVEQPIQQMVVGHLCFQERAEQ